MNDHGEAKKILGMRINRDKVAGKLYLSPTQYIERVLQRFNLCDPNLVGTSLGSYFKLSNKESPSMKKECCLMRKVPYTSAIGGIMYAMVCTTPDIGSTSK